MDPLKIGPTFTIELAAAGVSLQALAWDAAGNLYCADPAQLGAATAVLAKHDPTLTLPRSASAKQIRYALNDLGVRPAWNTALAAASQGEQDYWTSADPMYEGNAKVAKWCKAAGITPKALFDQAAKE